MKERKKYEGKGFSPGEGGREGGREVGRELKYVARTRLGSVLV